MIKQLVAVSLLSIAMAASAAAQSSRSPSGDPTGTTKGVASDADPVGKPVGQEPAMIDPHSTVSIALDGRAKVECSKKTADGKTDVVKAVSATGTGEREITPVKVSFALFDGDKKVSDLKPVALERGEAAVLYITGNGSNLSPVWVKRPTSTQ